MTKERMDPLSLTLVVFYAAHCAGAFTGFTMETPETTLKLTPDHGNMMGGEIVTIQGPTFQPYRRIQITIGEYRITCNVQNNTHAICRTPVMYGHGLVTAVYISHQNQQYFGSFFIENPLSADTHAWIENPESYNELFPDDIVISFDASKLSEESPDSYTNFKIQLWGYKEEKGNIHLELLWSNNFHKRNRDAWYSLSTGSIAADDFTTSFKIGMFKVTLQNEHWHFPDLWTIPVPFGWIFDKRIRVTTLSRGTWAYKMCQQWAWEDLNMEDDFDKLPCCPPTIEGIRNEINSFTFDDECNTRYRNTTCYSFSRVLSCYVSKQATKNGAGQQCCYNKMGQLTLKENANRKTSYPCRSHPFGSYSYDVIYRVPGLSHWHHDFIPYLTCCKWANACDIYQKRRPQKKCDSNSSQTATPA